MNTLKPTSTNINKDSHPKENEVMELPAIGSDDKLVNGQHEQEFKMTKITELSAFQKNLNYLTFYLYLMNKKCKHLQDFDDGGDFETHNYFLELCREKLNDKIQDDKTLLINLPLFNNFFTFLENKNKAKSPFKMKPEKNEEQLIYETYFEYSKSLSKSKLRNKSFNFIIWSLLALLFTILFIFIPLISLPKSVYPSKLTELMIPYTFLVISVIFSFYYLKQGIILRFVLNSNKTNKTKFRLMYSDDYCYRRIKESEAFFRTNYNVENEFLELSEVERQFPEKNNLFYNTIQEVVEEETNINKTNINKTNINKTNINKTNINKTNIDKLMKINANIYCRAVFSELFKSIKKDKEKLISREIQLQQIPFVFFSCLSKANLGGQGNKGFIDCINHLVGSDIYVDTSFNQYLTKYKKEKCEIQPKYLKILEKYENI